MTRAICLVLLCIACGGEDFEAKEPICDPGKTQACLCSGGDEGAQECAADGMKWGKCECDGGSGGDGGGPSVTTVGPGEECDGVDTICAELSECHGTCISSLGGECFLSRNCLGGLSCGENLRCTDRAVIPLGDVCGGPNDICEAPGECWLLDDEEVPRCIEPT